MRKYLSILFVFMSFWGGRAAAQDLSPEMARQKSDALWLLARDLNTSDLPESRAMGALAATGAGFDGAINALDLALAELRAPGALASPDSFARAVLPLIEATGQLYFTDNVDAPAVSRFNAGLKALDQAAKNLGRPTISELIRDYGGARAGSLLRLLGYYESVAEIADDRGTDEDEEHLRKRASALTALIPPDLLPAAPLVPFVRSNVVWTRQMMDSSTAGVDVVTEAIRTGSVDQKALAQVEARLERLRGGPWGTREAREFLEAICSRMPRLGSYCGDLFGLVVEAPLAIPVACRPINCQCDSISAGILSGGWRDQCLKDEASLLARCIADEVVSGSCPSLGQKAAPYP